MAVVLYFSISLDGYVAGPDISRPYPMGIGGEALHNWSCNWPRYCCTTARGSLTD